MSSLILRLAAPVQSWGGYRRLVSHVPTHPIPTRSGVAGLLGACLGERDYLSLLPRFDMRVRADRANPVMPEYQVAVGPTTPREREMADRAVKVSSSSNWARASFPASIIGTSAKGGNGVYHRNFIPHSEFICELSGTDDDVAQWLDAVRSPGFMPYLGRHANAPTWPFVLGVHHGEDDLFGQLPRVGGDPDEQIAVHHVTGDFTRHTTDTTWVTTPVADSREEQMTWVSQHLSR